MRPRSVLDAYFSPGVTAEQLVPLEGETHGVVRWGGTFLHGQPVAGGLFDPDIFGPPDGSVARWGRLDANVTLAGVALSSIPVPPIADRMPARTDPAMRVAWHGPFNDAWIALIQATARANKLAELGAPANILAREAAHVQAHFEDVLALHRGEEPPPHHPHEPLSEPMWLVWPCAPRGAEVRALLFIDEERVLVQTRAECRIVDRTGQTIGDPFKPTGPLASSACGDLVLFNAGQREAWARDCYGEEGAWPEDAAIRAPLAAYDLGARRWVDVADDRLPAWVVDETDVEGADAFDMHSATTKNLVPGMSPVQLAQTRDGRFTLVRVYRDDVYWHDAIVEIATRRLYVELPEVAGEPPIVAIGPETKATLAAVSYTPSRGWRVVDPLGTVGDGERWWYRLAGASCTAWSPSGAQLATIAAGELVILDVTAGGASVASRAHLG